MRLADDLRRDVRVTVRGLRREPWLAVVVSLTLALGIGANTAVFSLFYAVLLRPLPYHDPERLVRVQSHHGRTDALSGSSIADLDDWRLQQRTFVDLGAYLAFNSDWLTDGPARPIRMAWVTPSALAVLGVPPALGRLFRPEEDRPGADVDNAIVSHRLWQTELARDPGVLGRVVRVSNGTFRVVGVMPAGFFFPDQVDLWAPIQSGLNRSASPRSTFRGSRPYAIVGRLKPDVAPAAAQADLDLIGARLEEQFPTQNQGVRPRLTPLREVEVGAIRPYLVLLLSASGLVLIVCCANIASLIFARATARVREFAIRAALGASRLSLFRQVLIESVLIALIGGVLGLIVAELARTALLRLIPVELPFWMQVEIDRAVLAFNAIASVATGLLFGMLPAFAASSVRLTSLLKHGTAGAGHARFDRLKHGLVIAEIALSFALLVGAALLMRSFLHLQRTDLGFRTADVVTARVSPFRPGTLSQKIDAYASLYARVLTELRAMPGVEAAGGTVDVPFAGSRVERPTADVIVRGRSGEGDDAVRAPTAQYTISPGYVATMGIPLLSGRDFREDDDQQSLPVVMISARTAEMLWPGRDPLNRTLQLAVSSSAPAPWLTVVGVVGNIKDRATDPERAMEIYFPYRQRTAGAFYFVIRSRLPIETVAAMPRRALQAVDKDTAVVAVSTMSGIVAESLWQRRLWGVLLVSFAALALLLTAIGLYALMAFVVGQRTREFGIRLAIGEPPRAIAFATVRRGLWLVAIGLLIGALATWPLMFTVRHLVVGFDPSDPRLFVEVAIVLIAVSVLACVLPVRRIFAIDPVTALRE